MADESPELCETPNTAIKTELDAWPKRAPPSPFSGYRLPVGAHPGNTGGKKGRSGRPPKPWKQFCREVLTDPVVQMKMRKAAADPNTPGYSSIMKLLAEHGEGLPEQTIRIRDADDLRARLLSRLDSLAAASGQGNGAGGADSG
jgi:hypothetical protein